MKVFYVEGIVEKISRARREALEKDREIEKIVISPTEARELLDAFGRPWMAEPGKPFSDFDIWLCKVECGVTPRTPQPLITVMGIRVEVQT